MSDGKSSELAGGMEAGSQKLKNFITEAYLEMAFEIFTRGTSFVEESDVENMGWQDSGPQVQWLWSRYVEIHQISMASYRAQHPA